MREAWLRLVHPALVDGVPGALVTVAGRLVTFTAFTVADCAITAIRVLTDPRRLAQVVPSWAACSSRVLQSRAPVA